MGIPSAHTRSDGKLRKPAAARISAGVDAAVVTHSVPSGDWTRMVPARRYSIRSTCRRGVSAAGWRKSDEVTVSPADCSAPRDGCGVSVDRPLHTAGGQRHAAGGPKVRDRRAQRRQHGRPCDHLPQCDDSGPSQAHSWLAASIPPGFRARSACNLFPHVRLRRWTDSDSPSGADADLRMSTAEPAGRGSQKLVFLTSQPKPVVCPECSGEQVSKRLSLIAAPGSGSAESASTSAACTTST